MKARIVLITLLVLMTTGVFSRPIEILTPEELMADARLVFVGRVKSVKPSGIVTKFGYPTWEKTTFEWLATEVQVLEAFKGVKKGDTVKTLLLSERPSKEDNSMYSPPGMVFPGPRDVYFFCLSPTSVTNAFAALTTPYDDYLSIITLYREHLALNLDAKANDRFFSDNKEFDPIFSLVDKSGNPVPERANAFKNTYLKALTKTPSQKIVYLEWESRTNASGWSADFPKGYDKK